MNSGNTAQAAAVPMQNLNNMVMHQVFMPNVDQMIPVFSGNKSENFDNFWKKFSEVACEFQWTEGAKKLWFGSRLSGNAKQIWENLGNYVDAEKLKFEENVDRFREFFGYQNNFAQSLKLEEIKMNKDEPVASLKLRIENSVKVYLKDIIEDNVEQNKKIIDKMAFDQLVKAVPNEWKEKIIKSGLNSFEEASKMLHREQMWKIKVEEVCEKNQTSDSDSDFNLMLNEKNKQIEELQESLNAMRIRQNDFVANRSGERVFCKYCNISGHTINNCRRLNGRREIGFGSDRYVNRGNNFQSRQFFTQGNKFNKQNFLE